MNLEIEAILAEADIQCTPIESPGGDPQAPVWFGTVAGQDAFSAWQTIRGALPTRGGWPLILGDADELEYMSEALEVCEEGAVAQTLAAASQIDAAQWLAAQNNEREDWQDEMLNQPADWPSEPAREDLLFHSTQKISGREPHRRVTLAICPTGISHEAPAYLQFGGFNACPLPEEHVALLRRWEEAYGVEVVCITHDVIEMLVHRPPDTPQAARQLALEQFAYCADIVEQGTGSVDALAVSLWGSRQWFFWWD